MSSKTKNAQFQYKYNYVDLMQEKPILSEIKTREKKIQLIYYYVSSFFIRYSKQEIFDIFKNSAFYWDLNEHLILNSSFLIYDVFVDTNNHNNWDERKEMNIHEYMYFTYDFNDKKISLQGFLKDKNHNWWENPLIEDISKFNDNDLDYILGRKMIDYHIRDKEIKDYLDEIMNEYKLHTFYSMKKRYSNETNIYYLTCKKRNQKSVDLHFTRYSPDFEALCPKYKEKVTLKFLKKNEEVEDLKLHSLTELEVKEKIFKQRQAKVKNIEHDYNTNKSSIKNKQELIKSCQKDIEELTIKNNELDKVIKEKNTELQNTVIEDIKIL